MKNNSDNSKKARKFRLSPEKKLFILLIIALAVSVLYYFYFTEKINPVVEGRIYRSAQLSGEALEKIIKDKGIKTIVNLRGEFKSDKRYNREVKISKAYGVKHYDVRLFPDKLPEHLRLKTLVDILSSSDKPILIHCLYGVDRTGMASALALSIEKDAPLSEMRRQFSWRYGVLPFIKSIGPYFFSRYEDWLKEKEKPHNKDNLVYWIYNEYIDEQENLIFWADHANGVRFEGQEKEVKVSGNPQKVIMEGWAFNSRSNTGVYDLSIMVDGKVFKAPPATNRPDVARHFNLGDAYYEQFVVGWKIEFENGSVRKGCHEIHIKVPDGNSGVKILPAGSTLCI